jgi:hypothetical protein
VAIAADYSGRREPIHYSQIFDGKTPALCGKLGTPRPAANEWRYVECPSCLALVVHARRAADTLALCGAEPGAGNWTTKRIEVTCSACEEEITRRLR